MTVESLDQGIVSDAILVICAEPSFAAAVGDGRRAALHMMLQAFCRT